MNNGTFISQAKHARNLVKKFSLESTTHRRTPIGTHEKISRGEEGKVVDQSLYQSMIGSLLYLIANQPDLCYSVGICAQYQACPKESHLIVVKKIITYVSETTKFEPWYSYDSTTILMGDWARNSDDRKSTSGGCFFLGNNLVSWFRKK